ncbi:MAG: DUF4079 domain-containing protein [Cyanobacteria bacterium P01_A01_bin.45]
MDLPSFIWLWRIAAWAMGLSLFAYLLLAISGLSMFLGRKSQNSNFQFPTTWERKNIRLAHYLTGIWLVLLVLLLLGIGIVGTLGHFGSLGQSQHLVSGLGTVLLVVVSALSATQISPAKPWAKYIHVGTNIILAIAFIWVSITGWIVVQKYL